MTNFADARELQRRVKVFMCGVDWQHELGEASGGSKLFPSEGDCREVCKCIPQCGMVEVEVRLIRWVQEQDLDAKI